MIEWNCIDNNCIIANTDPIFTPFFSSGDLMISLLLFILLVIEMIKLVACSISSIKTNKKYLGNNSPDGKEIYHN